MLLAWSSGIKHWALLCLFQAEEECEVTPVQEEGPTPRTGGVHPLQHQSTPPWWRNTGSTWSWAQWGSDLRLPLIWRRGESNYAGFTSWTTESHCYCLYSILYILYSMFHSSFMKCYVTDDFHTVYVLPLKASGKFEGLGQVGCPWPNSQGHRAYSVY